MGIKKDPQLSEEKLRQAVRKELINAADALKSGDRKRAALYLAAALEPTEQIAELTDKTGDWDALAILCLKLSDFADVEINKLIGFDPTHRAAIIFYWLGGTTNQTGYFKKAEELMLAVSSSNACSSPHNYNKQSPDDLAKVAISLDNYDVLENEDEEILLCISPVSGGDEAKAVFFCDGGAHALLFKGPDCLMICDYLHTEVQSKLPKRKEVLCYETNNPDKQKAEYLAQVVSYPSISHLAEVILRRLGKM